MDLFGPNIFSTLWMKEQVLHNERAHWKVPDWSLVWNELLTKTLPMFLWEWLGRLKCLATGLDASLSFRSTSRRCSRKSFKKLQVQTRVENAFSFLREIEDVETLGKNGGQAVIPGSFKRRYEIRFWRLDLIIHCYHVYTLQSTGDVSTRLKSSLPSFLSILAHFPNQNYQSLSKEYNFNWCWHHTLHLKKKKISSSKVCSKHQGQQQRSSAAWRYRWLACVLVALQVLRTLSPGSRLRQLFPSLPSLPSDWSLNLYINWLGKIYILFVLGRYLFLEATDFFDHLSRTAVRFSDQIMTVNLSQLLTLVRIG